ncbi:MAG: hypothetical protein ACREVG_00560 [Burkholderiales bacterium]
MVIGKVRLSGCTQALHRRNEPRRRFWRVQYCLHKQIPIRICQYHALLILDDSSRGLKRKVASRQAGNSHRALNGCAHGWSRAQFHALGFALGSQSRCSCHVWFPRGELMYGKLPYKTTTR